MLSKKYRGKIMIETIVAVMLLLWLLGMGTAYAVNVLIDHSSHICDNCYIGKRD